MNKEFIPYEQALELKELGFDEKCLAYYHQDERLEVAEENMLWLGKYGVLAPLCQQAFRWFREKQELFHKIDSAYYTEGDPTKYYEDTRTIIAFRGFYMNKYEARKFLEVKGFYDTYEEAELACLKKLIEIVKNK